MHSPAGARQYEKDFCIYAGNDFLTELTICCVLNILCLKLYHVNSQISDYNSAKADFGTELAVSTRTELDPGDSIKLLCYSFENFIYRCMHSCGVWGYGTSIASYIILK
jgi:hypothetical protein